MAVHLINSIASIPASPAAGDIIRFSAAITTGIPSTLKKVDGTTTETAIAVGSEYRYYGGPQLWLKIGSDVSATPLKDVSVLASTEFSSAILAAVHNETASGRIRKFGMSILHKALQAVNPLEFAFEHVTLYDKTSYTQLPKASKTVPVNLDIKSGVTRHSFNDGYFAFTFFHSRGGYSDRNPDGFRFRDYKLVFKDHWDATQQAGGEVIPFIDSGANRLPVFWKASDTGFYVWTDTGFTTQIYKVVGHKLTLGLKTP